jgi:hypothetical protein
MMLRLTFTRWQTKEKNKEAMHTINNVHPHQLHFGSPAAAGG